MDCTSGRLIGGSAALVMSDSLNARMRRERTLRAASAYQEHDMKLSKRGEYALRALIDLGIASELGWPMLQISELASKEKLPIKFLEQIFTQLKAAGYVKSRRGKFGGYSLARPMSQIKFGAVIRLIDGPLAPIRCVSATSYARCSCPDEVHCGLRMLMFDVRNAISCGARSLHSCRHRRDHTSQISSR